MNAATFIHLVLIVAALVVMAEALNKLERCAPHRKGLTPRQRLVDALKAIAWALLALGAGGAIAGPVLPYLGGIPSWLALVVRFEQPTLDHVAVMLGFAVLIVRTRVKEG